MPGRQGPHRTALKLEGRQGKRYGLYQPHTHWTLPVLPVKDSESTKLPSLTPASYAADLSARRQS